MYQENGDLMEYALIAAVSALALGIVLRRRRKLKLKQLREVIDDYYTTTIFEPGGDPIRDRTEFHFTRRRD